jgi:hypothetical protein
LARPSKPPSPPPRVPPAQTPRLGSAPTFQLDPLLIRAYHLAIPDR